MALLSLASRPSVLDTQLLPKALLPLAALLLEFVDAALVRFNFARVRDRLRGPPERRGAGLGQLDTFSWIEGPRRSTNFEHARDRLIERHGPRAPI